MQRHDLIQGSPEWLAHRANTFNASDAPAMLGCSPYETRAQLLQRLATGITPEVGASTQRLFDGGHRAEELARPLAEEIIGEDLGRVVGSIDAGLSLQLGASFDGLTFMDDTVWEHKSLNESLRYTPWDEGKGAHLPKHFRVQMEQQLMVSGAERALFMASKWEGETLIEERHCWYVSDAALRAEILAGWKQFDADLAAYQPPTASAEKPVAQAVTALPAVAVQVEGQLAVKDNFKSFEAALRDFLDNKLIKKPQTDQDFADLDLQIKALKKAEDMLDAAEAAMLAQVAAVDDVKRAKDMLHQLARENRLAAEKVLKNRKEEIKAEVVADGVGKYRAHIAALNERLGKPYMPQLPVDFAGAIKGLKNLDSLRNAIDTELARAKIAANEVADRIDANLKHLREHADGFQALFPDTGTIVLKAAEDLQTLVRARIAEHKEAEQKRLDAERERIRAEEAARLEREQQERIARENREREAAEALERRQREAAAAPVVAAPAPVVANVVPMSRPSPAAPTPDTGARLKLGDINSRLAPISITADGLVELGFQPVATERASKLYRTSDFPLICNALIERIAAAQTLEAA